MIIILTVQQTYIFISKNSDTNEMCVMWAFFAGEKAKLEAERERLVHLKELETQKQQAEELRHLVMKVLFKFQHFNLSVGL